MSDLNAHAAELQRLADLRRRAASRLAGAAATKGSPASATDALTVLHALASSPDTASAALTLLHELQVHQVEVDLQAQELQESRAELESALRRQTELYDHQPVGCFTVDARLVMHELNQTGADMLGIEREDAFGLPIDAFFAVESARRFRAVLGRLDASAGPLSCGLRLCPKDAPEHQVLASLGADTAAQRYLVTLAMADEELHRPALAS